MNKGIAFLMITMVLWVQPFFGEVIEDERKEIPDEAIRLRILANSDTEEDQQLKRQVRDEVNAYIHELVAEIADIEEARQTIRRHVPDLEDIVEATLEEAGFDISYTVDYRSNVAFPTKKYDTYVYPAGEYEAVLITLGKGEGANWWCVLFPPLCFLDFSNGATVADVEQEQEQMEEESDEIDLTEAIDDAEATEESEEEDEIEVKFFLFEWLGIS